tara:strand:+ start:5394 stop:6665 length:1272 start_codon:yes stop_codon:yes gene_type:complete
METIQIKNLLKNRINILCHILIELLTCIILNFILNEIPNLEIFNFYNLIIWIFVSYIFDRYHLRSFQFKYIKKYILKTFGIFLFLSFFNFILGFKAFSILIFFALSIFTQFYYLKISSKKSHTYKKWLTNDISLIQMFQTNPKQFRNHRLVFFERNLKCNFSDLEGIILDNNLPENDLLKEANKFDKFKVFCSFDWCEIYTESFPLNIIKNHSFYKDLKKQKKISIYFILKRIFEFIFSVTFLIILSPAIFLFSLLVVFQDGFPIFYSQFRKGKNNRINKIFKIRSMKKDSEINGPQWCSYNDSRITFIGKFMRKNRIDELPQLFSVIFGELSLIGPRPERPEIDDFLKKEIDFYDYRYLLKPGITGWAQVNYPYGASIEDSKIKQSYDLYYVKNISIILDLIILLKTIRLILNGRGAVPQKK